jgi:rhodanese-related sulfurtransferase/bacterioferritin (cytochrome b1)
MKWKSLFKTVNSLEPAAAKAFMAARSAADYQLLDVRQPREYEEEHLPGARLIPLRELSERIATLDPAKPLLAYCAVGGRSRAAAQYLVGQGFAEVYSLGGGIKKWQGIKASGPEMSGLELIDGEADFKSGLALSYALEDGLQQFYARLAAKVDIAEQKTLLTRLAGFEDKHKAWLAEELARFGSGDSLPAAPRGDEAVMEGGRSLQQFLARVRPEFLTLAGIFDLAMMFETQAMDLYSRLARQAQDESSRTLFLRLVDEEKMHLGFLEKEYERMMG